MLYERLYGKSLQKNWNQSFTSSQIVENPELLQSIEEQNKENKSEPAEKEETTKSVKVEVVEPPPKPSSATTVLVAANKQVETRLPSGKRRITPMLLTPAPAK